MFNHSNSGQNSPYADLTKRIIQRVQANKVEDQILGIMHQVFEKELENEKALLSRQEKVRLFCQVTQAVLAEIVTNLDDAT